MAVLVVSIFLLLTTPGALQSSGVGEATITVSNTLGIERLSEPVVVSVADLKLPRGVNPASFRVMASGGEIPCQYDDLDGSGTVSDGDEIAFLADFSPKASREFKISYSTDHDVKPADYKSLMGDETWVEDTSQSADTSLSELVLWVLPRKDEIYFKLPDGSKTPQMFNQEYHGLVVLSEKQGNELFNPGTGDVFDPDGATIIYKAAGPVRFVVRRDLEVAGAPWSPKIAEGKKTGLVAQQTWVVYPNGRIYLKIVPRYELEFPTPIWGLGWSSKFLFNDGRGTYYLNQVAVHRPDGTVVRQSVPDTEIKSYYAWEPAGGVVEFALDDKYCLTTVFPDECLSLNVESHPEWGFQIYFEALWNEPAALKAGDLIGKTMVWFLHPGGIGTATEEVSKIMSPVQVRVLK